MDLCCRAVELIHEVTHLLQRILKSLRIHHTHRELQAFMGVRIGFKSNIRYLIVDVDSSQKK